MPDDIDGYGYTACQQQRRRMYALCVPIFSIFLATLICL